MNDLNWQILVSETAAKQIERLDKPIQTRILKYLKERLLNTKNPRSFGKGLTGDKAGLWRYRVGDYRIICQVKDETVTILVLEVGHRKNIYD